MSSVDCGAPVTAPIVSENDVSGIGVIIGFMLMAWTSIAILALHYVVAYNPRNDPFRTLAPQKEGGKSNRKHVPNAVDIIITDYLPFRAWLRPTFRSAHTMELAFNKYVLGLADAQLVTGLAIMMSGYYCLSQGLSSYHWNIIIYLAWFACLTHLAALSFLRTYLHNNPIARAWRLVLMTVVFVLLFVGYIPTGHFNFVSHESDEAVYDPPLPLNLTGNGRINWASRIFDSGDAFYQCETYQCRPIRNPSEHERIYVMAGSFAAWFFKGGMVKNDEPFLSMTLSLVLLTYSYAVRVGKLFQLSSSRVFSTLRGTLDKGYSYLLTKCEAFLQWCWPSFAYVFAALFLPLIGGLYCTLNLMMDLWSSSFMEVCSLIIAGSWGTLRLADTRKLGSYEDDTWSFGQVMPLVLFTLPLISLMEILLPLTIHSVREYWESRAPLWETFHLGHKHKGASRAIPSLSRASSFVPFLRGRQSSHLSTDKTNSSPHKALEAIAVGEDVHFTGYEVGYPVFRMSRENTLVANESNAGEDVEHRATGIHEDHFRREVTTWLRQTRDVYTTKSGLLPILTLCAPLLFSVIPFLSDRGKLSTIWLFSDSRDGLYPFVIGIVVFVPFCAHISMAYVINTMWALRIRDNSKWRHLVRFIYCIGFTAVAMLFSFAFSLGLSGLGTFGPPTVGIYFGLTIIWSLIRLICHNRAIRVHGDRSESRDP